MALIRYSTKEQLDANLEKITLKLIDAQKEERIDQADKFIKGKLVKIVDFIVIDAMVTVPDWLNCLSQYLSCVLAIAKVYGAKRDAADVTDLKFWDDRFRELLTECQNNEIDFGMAASGAGNFTWDARRHVKPMFGPATTPKENEDNYGEYVDLEDLQDDREYDNTGDV